MEQTLFYILALVMLVATVFAITEEEYEGLPLKIEFEGMIPNQKSGPALEKPGLASF